MSDAEFLRKCANMVESYITDHPEELHAALFADVGDCASQDEVIWKVAINSVKYSCRISAMFAGMLLRQSGSDSPGEIAQFPPVSGLPA